MNTIVENNVKTHKRIIAIRKNEDGISNISVTGKGHASMFCNCSEEPVLAKLRLIRVRPAGNPRLFLNTITEEVAECTKCGIQTNTIISNHHGETYTEIDYAKIYDNDDKVSLSIGVSNYVYNAKVNKIGYRKIRVRYTFNKNTGLMYKMTGGKINTVSYKKKQHSSGAKNDWISVISKWYPDTYYEFAELCLRKRGIYDFLTDEQLIKCKRDTNYLFGILRLPALLSLPPISINGVPKELRKPLSSASGAKDVFNILAGTKSKKVRRLCDNEQKVNFLLSSSSVIKLPENLEKLLSLNVNWTDYHFLDNPFKNFFKKSINASEEVNLLEFTKDCLGVDETRLTNMLVEEAERMGPDRFLYRLKVLLSDIYRLCEDTKDFYPGFVIPKSSGIKELHDKLAYANSMLSRQNVIIEYTNDELFNLNDTVDGIEFRLVEDTSRLQDISQVLQHCVSAYSKEVVRKSLYIIQAYKDGQYLATLEIQDNAIRQAKGYRNSLPSIEIGNAIIKWARGVSFNTDTCLDTDTYDLKNLKEYDMRPRETSYIPYQVNNNVVDYSKMIEGGPVWEQQRMPF